MTVTLREVTQEDLPIFFEHQLDAEATRMAAFPAATATLYGALARIMSKETNETGILNTILADDTVAATSSIGKRRGSRTSPTGSQDTLGKGIASAALAQFLTKIETRPVYAHVANTMSLRYVSYKNADSNLHERKCAMAMMAKNLLWSCAPIVAPRRHKPQRLTMHGANATAVRSL